MPPWVVRMGVGSFPGLCGRLLGKSCFGPTGRGPSCDMPLDILPVGISTILLYNVFYG